MKKNTKTILSLSLFCIILGGAAALFGSLNGGIETIQKATQPQKVDKNITSFKELNFDLPTRHLTIEPSKDNNWHLSYYTDDKILGKVQVRQEEETLNLKQNPQGSFFSGIITTFGYYLNHRDNRDNEYQTIVLSVPKETQMKTIKGYVSGNTRLYNLKLENLDLSSGSIHTDELTINQGTLSASALFLDNTQVEQLNLTDYNYLSLTNSNLKHAKLAADYASTDIDNSQLHNTTINANNNTLKLTNTLLDNVTLLGEFNDISATRLKLQNLVDISNAYNRIDINLDDKTKATTNLNLTVTDAKLDLSKAIIGTASIASDDDGQRFNKQVKDNTATLTIRNKEANLAVN